MLVVMRVIRLENRCITIYHFRFVKQKWQRRKKQLKYIFSVSFVRKSGSVPPMLHIVSFLWQHFLLLYCIWGNSPDKTLIVRLSVSIITQEKKLFVLNRFILFSNCLTNRKPQGKLNIKLNGIRNILVPVSFVSHVRFPLPQNASMKVVHWGILEVLELRIPCIWPNPVPTSIGIRSIITKFRKIL